MLPQTWMRHPEFVKTRKTLSKWTGQDFLNLAHVLFSTEDITDSQLFGLISELRKPDIEPPSNFKRSDKKLVFESNSGGKYTGKNHRIFLSSKKVKIHFSDKKDFLQWACSLVTRTNMTWEKAYEQFQKDNLNIFTFHFSWLVNKNHASEVFNLPAEMIQVDHQLQKFLGSQTTNWNRVTTAYPDNTPLSRAYYSLSKDDKLMDSEGALWKINQVKQKLDQPPEVTVEMVES